MEKPEAGVGEEGCEAEVVSGVGTAGGVKRPIIETGLWREQGIRLGSGHSGFSASSEAGPAGRRGIVAGFSRDAQRAEGTQMYAVIKTGGKQYRVAAGETLKVERLVADIGADVTLDQIVAIGSGADLVLGAPLVAGATVVANVVSHGRHPKVRIFKMHKRKHYQKRQGHRQNFTEIRISAVNAA
jgi:large subunit ribosomal protein L21